MPLFRVDMFFSKSQLDKETLDLQILGGRLETSLPGLMKQHGLFAPIILGTSAEDGVLASGIANSTACCRYEGVQR